MNNPVISPNELQNEQNIGGKKLKISGLCCANCARELEEILNGISGVKAIVDFMNMQIVLHCDGVLEYEKAVYEITHFEEVKIIDGKPQQKSLLKMHLYDLLCIAIATLFFIPALIFTVLKLQGVYLILSYIFYFLLKYHNTY